MINLCYVLIILLVALMIKLYLDSNKSKNKSITKLINYNNNYNDTNDKLESDPTFKKLLEQIKTDTESKINMAVEEGFSDGYKAMVEQDDNISNYKGENVTSYLNKNNSVRLTTKLDLYSEDYYNNGYNNMTVSIKSTDLL